MKAKLEFNLPEDINDFKLANRASDYWMCLWDLDQEARASLKYHHDFKTPEEVLDWVRDFIREYVDIYEVA